MRTETILLIAFAAFVAIATVDAAPNAESDRQWMDFTATWTDDTTGICTPCADGEEAKLNGEGECYCKTSDCSQTFNPDQRGQKPCIMAALSWPPTPNAIE